MNATHAFLNLPENLTYVERFIDFYRGNFIKVSGKIIYLCDLNGTIYKDRHNLLEEWQDLYLPNPVKMAVIGKIQKKNPFVFEHSQMIILLGEDGKVYGFYQDKLYILAETKHEFIFYGMKLNNYFEHPKFDDDDVFETTTENEDYKDTNEPTNDNSGDNNMELN